MKIQNTLDSTDTVPRMSILEENVLLGKYKYWASFFICGLINNSGYVMVGTAAQEVAHHFNMDNYMGAFNLSLIMFSIFLVGANAKLFINFSHRSRIITILFLSALALCIIGFSTSQNHRWAFYVALLGSTLQGSVTSLGEVNMLGYAKHFPSFLIGAWSSGTGLAGIFGSGAYLLLVYAGVKDLYIFLSIIPCLFIYFIAFSWLESKRIQYQPQFDHTEYNSIAEQAQDPNDDSNNKQLSIVNIKIALFQYSGWYSLNFGLVYFLEYSCTVLWANLANPKVDEVRGFLQDNTFAILGFSYQIGVFISRSSLSVMRVKSIHILTFIQAINTLVWIYIAFSHKVGIPYQIPLMVFVGLMGGASYVNIAYNILSSEIIPQNMKELCLNINNISCNIGITFAALLAIIVDNAVR